MVDLSSFVQPNIDMEATGANITRLRKEKGYSVKDLQAFCLVDSVQAVYKWQNGKSLPDHDKMITLSYLFGVTINEIYVYTGCDCSRIWGIRSCVFPRSKGYNHTAAFAA